MPKKLWYKLAPYFIVSFNNILFLLDNVVATQREADSSNLSHLLVAWIYT